MIEGKFNVITDGAFGSSGKGKFTTYLALRDKVQYLSTTNMANAGHTAELDGKKFIGKILPACACINWKLKKTGFAPKVYIGPTAAFQLSRFFEEMKELDLGPSQVVVHPRAGVITEEHKVSEAGLSAGPKHIASTLQGCGTFLADKILRKKELMLAKDYSGLSPMVSRSPGDFVRDIHSLLKDGKTFIHEGSQGFALDISHGHSYPNCTSRSTTALQNMADMAIPPSMAGDVYLILRTFPIRVGNIVEGGEQIGYSGDWYPDQQETTWDEIGKAAGMPKAETDSLFEKEKTTVTKRLRRVATFSKECAKQAVRANGATKLILNFVQYIDWKAYKVKEWSNLPKKVTNFIDVIESETGLKVAMIGTGADNDDIIDLEKWTR